MSLSKEDAMIKAKKALERAQDKYDKALAAYQDEMDLILLKPAHARVLSRKEVVALARAIENDECFSRIMAMGALPERLVKNNTDREEETHEFKNN